MIKVLLSIQGTHSSIVPDDWYVLQENYGEKSRDSTGAVISLISRVEVGLRWGHADGGKEETSQWPETSF